MSCIADHEARSLDRPLAPHRGRADAQHRSARPGVAHSMAPRSGRAVSIGRVTRRQGELLHLLLAGETRAVTLAGRWVLRKANSQLWLEPPQQPPPFVMDLEPGRRTTLPISGWMAFYGPTAEASPSSTWRYPCQPGQGLALRSAQVGDRLTNGAAVRTIFKNKVPRHLRRSWPILCCGAKILWIPGVGNDTGSSGSEWIVEVMRT